VRTAIEQAQRAAGQEPLGDRIQERGSDQHGHVLEALKHAYWGAKTQYERRAIALRAIDEELVGQGTPIRAVDEIFGTRCRVKGHPGSCIVEFLSLHEIEKEGEVKRREYEKGWYMSVQFDTDGKISCYELKYPS
jgi:hypothetical protein